MYKTYIQLVSNPNFFFGPNSDIIHRGLRIENQCKKYLHVSPKGKFFPHSTDPFMAISKKKKIACTAYKANFFHILAYCATQYYYDPKGSLGCLEGNSNNISMSKRNDVDLLATICKYNELLYVNSFFQMPIFVHTLCAMYRLYTKVGSCEKLNSHFCYQY